MLDILEALMSIRAKLRPEQIARMLPLCPFLRENAAAQ